VFGKDCVSIIASVWPGRSSKVGRDLQKLSAVSVVVALR
jgi:hypothetical protein